MNGLIIWAYENCRSTMALYREMQKAADFPVRIALLVGDGATGISSGRAKTGFRADEFCDVEMYSLKGDYSRGVRLMDESKGYAHMFCAYQLSSIQRQLVDEAKRRGEVIIAAGEAPCNMDVGSRWLLKEIFLRFALRGRVKNVVQSAKAFLCFSGDAYDLASLVGWPREKVVPFGYFPPPIEGASCVRRTSNRDFHILSTGILARYRGADVLLRALWILKDRGVRYRATITQDGELLPKLKNYAVRYGLPVDFPGFVPLPKLVNLYETCSVYVGAGRREPWGMRLNDALNCGAPLVVSRGMGGVKLVDDYGCGLACARENAEDMADQLEKLATDDELYRTCVDKAVCAAELIQPQKKAAEVLALLKGWDGLHN